MRYPTPEDMAQAPVWENCLICQAVPASLGLIPRHALAVGIDTTNTTVEFCFQMSEVSDADETDMADIVDEFEMLVGDVVDVSRRFEVRDRRSISGGTETRWFFLSRVD